MKRLILLLLFATLNCNAQYFSVSIEPNKLFNIIDNPRTEVDNKGLDFHLETGAYAWDFGVYAYYGRFENLGYQIFGFGLDYYLVKNEWLDLSLGAGIGNLLRKYTTGAHWEREAWFGYATWHSRLEGVIWIWDNFGATGSMTYQRRPDLPKLGGIIEGNIGLRYKL